MIREVHYWSCTECGYITPLEIISCPMCSFKARPTINTYRIYTMTGNANKILNKHLGEDK